VARCSSTGSTPNHGWHERAAISYITGTHNYKVGFNHDSGWQKQRTESDQPVTYRFNNGVPNQITMMARPIRWTRKSATISASTDRTNGPLVA
jgi:hypothetical protein